MAVKFDKGKDIFETFKVVFYGLINFGLFERILVLADIFFNVSCDLLNICKIHICGNKTLDHFIVEKDINEFKVHSFLQIQVIL